MPKFPFTNYHELNLDWILKKVNALFDASEENARTIRTYDTRLNSAEQTATSAATAATSAQQLADAAAANADNALSVAGTADSKADSALTAATEAAGSVAGALTAAQEARQTAGAAVATANDAAATAAGLESLANTANQNATAAVETAGAAAATANSASAAAQTADQKAVAAQQTANSAQTAANTNAGNISTLQTNVIDLNRQINKLDNQLLTDSFNILTKDKSAYSENYLGAKFENFVIDGHVTQPQNICITSKSRKTPTTTAFSQLSEDYFSIYLEANKTYTFAMCVFSEYNVPDPAWTNVFTLADYTTRTAKIYNINTAAVRSKEIYTASITVSTSDYYAIKINFPPYPTGGNYRVCFALYPPKNIYQLIASASALTLSN